MELIIYIVIKRIMGKVKNNRTQCRWEFFDRRGNLRRLGKWYRKYKATRTKDVKHKKTYVL